MQNRPAIKELRRISDILRNMSLKKYITDLLLNK